MFPLLRKIECAPYGNDKKAKYQICFSYQVYNNRFSFKKAYKGEKIKFKKKHYEYKGQRICITVFIDGFHPWQTGKNLSNYLCSAHLIYNSIFMEKSREESDPSLHLKGGLLWIGY